MTQRLTILAAVIGVLWAVCPVQGQVNKPPRYAALLTDGRHLEGERLSDWHTAESVAKLDGQSLWDEGHHLRWLRDRQLRPGPAPRAFVETWCGDRLPGEVVGYQRQEPASYDPLPDHFVIRAQATLQPPQAVSEPQVRVVAAYVRRVVWQSGPGRAYRPGTLFYRDGRQVQFRAVRFGQNDVQVLLESGPQRVTFKQVGEIHLPARDAWQAYFDELAVLSPTGHSRLLQLETTEGLLATGSWDRFDVHVRGNHQDSGHWFHGLQPAWSLDMLWVPNARVWVRRSFAPHEVPLTRVPPSGSRQHSPLSGPGRSWQLNRNVHQQPLHSGGRDFGWGFGVHALSELHFPLPDCVVAFRSQVGLDRIAGSGGCIRARVFVDSTSSPPLYESPFLVGSEQTADTERLALEGPAGGQQELILQIDPAHQGRPPGADPLDIRDTADWLDPLLELDPAEVDQELAGRRNRQFLAWQGWQLAVPPASDQQAPDSDQQAHYEPQGAVGWTSFRDQAAPQPGRYRRGVVTTDRPLLLSRQLTLGSEDRWLIVAASRPVQQGQPPQIEVRVAGEAVARHEVPLRDKWRPEPAPLAVRLSDYHDAGPLDVQLRQLPGSEPVPVHWHAIRTAGQLPTLYELFEDQGRFVALQTDGQPAPEPAMLVEDDRHSGLRAVRIPAGGRHRLQLKQPVPIRAQPGWGQYRYLRFAFRKSGGGRVCLELEHPRAREKPARYDAGMGDPCFGEATRVWLQELPDDWVVITRDLYPDFDELDVTGLTLSVPDGDHALLDHIYLARTQGDFELAEALLPAAAPRPAEDLELATELLDKVRSATVGLDFADGRPASGVIIHEDGHLLTAGHVAARPDRQVIVHLADGRAVKGRTRGIFRDLDVGMIKIESDGPWPAVAVRPAGEPPTGGGYFALAHRPPFAKEGPPPAELRSASMRQVLLDVLRTDLPLQGRCVGGPLLDEEGRLLGIHCRNSRLDGGLLYTRLDTLSEHLGRLREGQVWGHWPPDIRHWKAAHNKSDVQVFEVARYAAAGSQYFPEGVR